MGFKIKGIILSIAVLTAIISSGISGFTKATSVDNVKSNSIKEEYILGEFDGHLAIFKTKDKTPLKILDVRLTSLPERDIEKIKSGISAASLNEIMQMVEDYE